jgi:hypothetical protein
MGGEDGHGRQQAEAHPPGDRRGDPDAVQGEGIGARQQRHQLVLQPLEGRQGRLPGRRGAGEEGAGRPEPEPHRRLHRPGEEAAHEIAPEGTLAAVRRQPLEPVREAGQVVSGGGVEVGHALADGPAAGARAGRPARVVKGPRQPPQVGPRRLELGGEVGELASPGGPLHAGPHRAAAATAPEAGAAPVP